LPHSPAAINSVRQLKDNDLSVLSEEILRISGAKAGVTFAVTDGEKAIGRNSFAHEKVKDGVRPALREKEVGIVRPVRRGVPFDHETMMEERVILKRGSEIPEVLIGGAVCQLSAALAKTNRAGGKLGMGINLVVECRWRRLDTRWSA
jgi:hypothetical protein